MSIDCVSPSGVSLWHHGIKGQKWGVRRTPEQLGHRALENKPIERVMIVNNTRTGETAEAYKSEKGFVVVAKKLTGYCLNPDSKHSNEFFRVGYSTEDAELLFRDIEKGFDLSKKTGIRTTEDNEIRFTILMDLGVTEKQEFLTSWQIGKNGEMPKLTSAYKHYTKREEHN